MTVDSNYSCIENLDNDSLPEHKAALSDIHSLYHHSSSEAINKIVEKRMIWFTSFEKQKSEKVFASNKKGIFFVSSFSEAKLSKEELSAHRFKGGTGVGKVLTLEFTNIFDIFDKDRCCVLVTKKGERYNIRFVGRNSTPNPTEKNELINNIFVRVHTQKVSYVGNRKNITILDVLDSMPLYIANNVGKLVKDHYSYQREIKMVAELMSASPFDIEEPERLEIRFNPTVDIASNKIS